MVAPLGKQFRALEDCMGWDYVSELLPLTDISLIPQMIYEYGERRWNDIDGKTE
jgi:hypothetical protein